MPGCQKCWRDAERRAARRGTYKVTEYHALLEERKANPCTPEEQCGEMHLVLDWKDGRRQCYCGKVVEEAKKP